MVIHRKTPGTREIYGISGLKTDFTMNLVSRVRVSDVEAGTFAWKSARELTAGTRIFF